MPEVLQETHPPASVVWISIVACLETVVALYMNKCEGLMTPSMPLHPQLGIRKGRQMWDLKVQHFAHSGHMLGHVRVIKNPAV